MYLIYILLCCVSKCYFSRKLKLSHASYIFAQCCDKREEAEDSHYGTLMTTMIATPTLTTMVATMNDGGTYVNI